jgi:glycine/D-amino acid oxidase-like deaminating enzyme
VSAPDVAIAGGGIVGVSLAALLAEGGASVHLYEREAIGAGASGRNSGTIQHPTDELLVDLHLRSLELYAGLGHGFELPPEPAGVILVSPDAARMAQTRDEVAARFPELAAELIEDVRAVEPAVAEGLAGVRMHTGRPVPPAAAAAAWAQRAREAGAEIRVGEAAERAEPGALIVGGERVEAGDVVVAAGPWTPEIVDPGGTWRPIHPVWGVNLEVRLADPPAHVLEEDGIEALTTAGDIPPLFSIVTAGGVSAVGSTFLPFQPELEEWVPRVLARAARHLPELAQPGAVAPRACARPQSFDGRPLLGALEDRLHVASGHGPWGVSLGPGSAQLVADTLLRGGDAIPAALRASRSPRTSPTP